MEKSPLMFAKRAQHIHAFRVMELVKRAIHYENQGLQVVHFEVGEPDFSTAEPIVAAGQRALSRGELKYTEAVGIAPLREAIANHYATMGLSIGPERIIVTSGASGGLTLLAGLLLDPGDELLITDPGYPCNEVFAMLAGGVPKRIPVHAQQRFQPNLADVERAWGEKSKGLLLASPANPTGTMLPKNDLAQIGRFADQQNGFLILDEIYQGLTRGAEYQSGLQVDPKLFVLNSFSKFFGMTGWRLGWLVLPSEAQEPVAKMAQHLFIAPSTIAQLAALEAFSDEAMAIHHERAATFERRAQQLQQGLLALGFHVPITPEGGFYLFVDVSHTGLDGETFSQRLIDEYQVAVTPSSDFGDQFPNYVRFAYTTDEASIALGLERIATALQAWGVG